MNGAFWFKLQKGQPTLWSCWWEQTDNKIIDLWHPEKKNIRAAFVFTSTSFFGSTLIREELTYGVDKVVKNVNVLLLKCWCAALSYDQTYKMNSAKSHCQHWYPTLIKDFWSVVYWLRGNNTGNNLEGLFTCDFVAYWTSIWVYSKLNFKIYY